MSAIPALIALSSSATASGTADSQVHLTGHLSIGSDGGASLITAKGTEYEILTDARAKQMLKKLGVKHEANSAFELSDVRVSLSATFTKRTETALVTSANGPFSGTIRGTRRIRQIKIVSFKILKYPSEEDRQMMSGG
jgi:hypothetical protein